MDRLNIHTFDLTTWLHQSETDYHSTYVFLIRPTEKLTFIYCLKTHFHAAHWTTAAT